MTTQRKITLTFLDLNTARTIGWPLRYFARQLGLWADRTDIEIHNLLQNGLDTTKFQLSTVLSPDFWKASLNPIVDTSKTTNLSEPFSKVIVIGLFFFNKSINLSLELPIISIEQECLFKQPLLGNPSIIIRLPSCFAITDIFLTTIKNGVL